MVCFPNEKQKCWKKMGEFEETGASSGSESLSATPHLEKEQLVLSRFDHQPTPLAPHSIYAAVDHRIKATRLGHTAASLYSVNRCLHSIMLA